MPNCRETESADFQPGLNLDSSPDSRTTVGASDPGTRAGLPRVVTASPPRRLRQSRFIQACALPRSLVEAIHDGECDRNLVLAASQWRLDLPPPSETDVPSSIRQLLATVESILTRGAMPFCLPELEDIVPGLAPEDVHQAELLRALRAVAIRPTCSALPPNHDSEEEAEFKQWLMAVVRVDERGWRVLPQVHLSSIADGFEGTEERGDFLLTHVSQKPLLVEIDGEEHASHKERDHARDRALEASGVGVRRVPASEVRDRSGPNLVSLQQQLAVAPIETLADDSLSLQIRAFKFATQLQMALLYVIRGGWVRLGVPCHLGVVLPDALVNQGFARDVANGGAECGVVTEGGPTERNDD